MIILGKHVTFLFNKEFVRNIYASLKWLKVTKNTEIITERTEKNEIMTGMTDIDWNNRNND